MRLSSTSVRSGRVRRFRQSLGASLRAAGDRVEGKAWVKDIHTGGPLTAYRQRARCFHTVDELAQLARALQKDEEPNPLTVYCGSSLVATGPGFAGLEEATCSQPETLRRSVRISSESDETRRWQLTLGPGGRRKPPIQPGVEVYGNLGEERLYDSLIYKVEQFTHPYGWFARLRKKPLIKPVTERELEAQSHDLRVTRKAARWGLAAGALSGGTITWALQWLGWVP